MASAAAYARDSAAVLSASLQACHGLCYGFESERDAWSAPQIVVSSTADARPGYNTLDASEYVDTGATFEGKVRALARLIGQARCCVIYSGAGLSTGAGICDYASQATGSLSGVEPQPRAAMLLAMLRSAGPQPAGSAATFRSPFCAQPTLAHRTLVAMHSRGLVHRWINQNHDGLPQKAGLPQETINEIHGAWHAPDNPVVQMSGSLRDDLFADMLACERDADLAIAVGTSLCGMNSDRVVTSPAARAARREKGQFGSVVIGLQRTVHDEESTLRIFGRCDDVFAALAVEMALGVSPAMGENEFFIPVVLIGRTQEDYVFEGVPYDMCGKHSPKATSTLDLRDGAELVIPSGTHAGAVGEVDGLDREGNIRCRFKLKAKVGKLRAPVAHLLGRWWLQAAVDGTVPTLPVVNRPSDAFSGSGAKRVRALMQAYAAN